MPQRHFKQIFRAREGRSIFTRSCAEIRCQEMHPQTRIITSLRVIGYMFSFHDVDELCGLSQLSALDSFYAFLDDIVEIFDNENLCKHSEKDLGYILSMNAARGFTDSKNRGTVRIGNRRTGL